MKKTHTLALLMAIAFLLAFVGVVFFSQNGYIDYRELQAEKAALKEENQNKYADIRCLRRQTSRLKNDWTYLEHIARTEFGLVYRTDVVYKFTNGSGED